MPEAAPVRVTHVCIGSLRTFLVALSLMITGGKPILNPTVRLSRRDRHEAFRNVAEGYKARRDVAEAVTV